MNGTQKQISAGFVKVNGVWKQGVVVSEKVNGIWKQSWKNAFPMPTFLTYPTSIIRGQTISWSTQSITGANYEWQVAYNNGTWSTSTFSTTPTGQYVISSDTTLNTFQMRIRSVDPTTHQSQSPWITGSSVTITPATLSTPTGLTYPSSIARGDKVRIYWNVTESAITYEIHVVLKDASGGTSDQVIYASKTSSTGQTYFDYMVPTTTSWKNISFYIKAKKPGYYDSPFETGAMLTLSGQKLGTVPSMDVPSVIQGSTVSISWGSVSNASQYQVEVIYDTQTTYTAAYTGASRSFNFTFPTNHQYVQFRVKATSPNYTDGDWHYAWAQGVALQPPPLKSTTWNATETHNYRDNFNGQWDANNTYVMQGSWTDDTGYWGNYQGLAFFDYQNIRSVLAGKTISKVQLYFYRIKSPDGYFSGQPITLYTHNYSSRPSGRPILNPADGPLGSWPVAVGSWVTVSNVVAERIRDGSATGIGLYDSKGDHYLKMASNVQLYVEYR